MLERLFASITDKKVTVGVTKEDDRLHDEDKRPDWTEIGFQGLDPVTDFRGGGLLSLQVFGFFQSSTNTDFSICATFARRITKSLTRSMCGQITSELAMVWQLLVSI